MVGRAALRGYRSTDISRPRLWWSRCSLRSTFLGLRCWFVLEICILFFCHLHFSSTTSSQTICSKVSAYFRGSNPHQADFMQQGARFALELVQPLTTLQSGRALLKLERARLEQQAVFVACDPPFTSACSNHRGHAAHPCFSGRNVAPSTRFMMWMSQMKSTFKSQGRNAPLPPPKSANIEMQDFGVEGDRSPLSPTRNHDSSNYALEDDV